MRLRPHRFQHPPSRRRHPAAPEATLRPEQLQRIAELRAFAAKKDKVAKFLIAEDLAEEAERHRKAAEMALQEAAAIERPTA